MHVFIAFCTGQSTAVTNVDNRQYHLSQQVIPRHVGEIGTLVRQHLLIICLIITGSAMFGATFNLVTGRKITG